MTVVFIDRDGVINENRDGYVRSVDDLVFLPGALEGLARLKEAGATVVVITNQAGVGRGLIEPGELDRINRRVVETVARHGGEIAAVYCCTHRREDACSCRKPEPGLILAASRDLDLELSGSYLIGDADTDILAGHRAGCRTVLVLTGRTPAGSETEWKVSPDHIAPDLPSAVEWLLHNQT